MFFIHQSTEEKQFPKTFIIFVSKDSDLYLDQKCKELSEKIKALPEFNSEKESIYNIYQPEEFPLSRVILAGLGEKKDIDKEALRKASALALKTAKKSKEKKLGIYIPELFSENEKYDFVEAITEGLLLSNYNFEGYKKEKKEEGFEEFHFVERENPEKLKSIHIKSKNICDATNMARSWVSMPPNEKKPQLFADMIEEAAKKEGLIVERFGEKDLKEKGFNSLLAVNKGSNEEAALLVLRYKTEKKDAENFALIGKGVCFDSGGLDLKPPSAMEDMKMDMAGAAAVAATSIALARTEADFNFITAIPIVENMPSGRAMRPGDIISSYSGKSIEVLNTDAEGRLILADTLAFVAKNEKPDLMIDIATLTGACMMALGEDIAGVFSEDSTLSQKMARSGEEVFEPCWPLPLPENYKKLLKSEFADIKNISSSRYGGAITAALFLKEFTEDIPWIHIDIAGPAYNSKAKAYCPVGGSGFGVRLLHHFLSNFTKKEED